MWYEYIVCLLFSDLCFTLSYFISAQLQPKDRMYRKYRLA